MINVMLNRECLEPDNVCEVGLPIDYRPCEDKSTRATCCYLVNQNICTNPDGNPNTYMNEDCAQACCCANTDPGTIYFESNMHKAGLRGRFKILYYKFSLSSASLSV